LPKSLTAFELFTTGLEMEPAVPPMPFPLPPRQEIPSAWLGRDLATRPQQWIVELSPAQLAELKRAAANVRGVALADLTADVFPLPALAQTLAALRQTLIQGLGFALVRGLNPDEIPGEDSAAVFCGLGAHIGRARSQNAAGELLGHVRDIGASGTDTNTRIYQTRERQTFHTDSADVVALMCLRQARTGGESLLVSAASIYNAFLERRPDLLPRLFETIATDRRGEVPEGMKSFFEIPVFTWHGGYLNVMYQRQYIDSAQRFAGAMRLTPEHVAALDLFDELANNSDLNLGMTLRRGDMQFVHNHSLLHDRAGFEDWPEPARRRHLLRLWLSVPGDRPLPDVFAERFGTTTVGDRGGIVVAD
jgi:hypothetical protein